MPAQGTRVDLGPGQEGQQDRAEGGQEVDPRGGLQAEDVASDDAQHDLD